MERRPRPYRSSRGFSLLEMLVSVGVLSMIVVGLYAAFLKANEYAVTSRVNTAAKIILERAVNYALTVNWDASNDVPSNYTRDEVLQPTPATGKLYSLYDPSSSLPAGQVTLFKDPQQQDVIVGNLYRTVTELGGLDPYVLITFRLDDITYRSRLLPPVTTYTVRTRNK